MNAKVCQRCGRSTEAQNGKHIHKTARFTLDADDSDYFSQGGINLTICRTCMESLINWISEVKKQ
jgi:hypothetical protein